MATAAAASVAAALCLVLTRDNWTQGADYATFLAHLKAWGLWSLAQATAPGVARSLGYAALTFFYFGSLYFLGREIARAGGLRYGDSLIGVLSKIALGAGALPVLLMGLGLARALYPGAVIALLVLPWVSAARGVRIRRAPAATPHKSARNRDVFLVAAAVLLALFACVAWVQSAAPATASDARMYHLAMPELYLKYHTIRFMPWFHTICYPQSYEMHMLAGLALRGDIMARCVNFGFVLCAAAAAAAVARPRGGAHGALAAALAFLAMPLVCIHFHYANVEPLLALFVLMAARHLLDWLDANSPRTLAAAAVFCGFAIAVKLTAVLFAAAVFAIVLIHILRSRNAHPAPLKPLALFCVLAALPVLPWLIRSAIHTGNPVWPFFNAMFGGRYWDALHERDKGYFLAVHFRDPAWATPWDAVVSLFHRSWSSNLGLALPAVLPFVFTFRNRSWRDAGVLVFLGAAMAAGWYATTPQPRFLLPVLALVCAALGSVLPPRQAAVRLALVCAAAFHLMIFSAAALRNMPFALGAQAREQYLESDGLESVYQYAGRNLAPDARLMLLWTSEGFGCPRDYIWGGPFDQDFIDYSEYKSPRALLRRLRHEGVTHVVFHTRGLYAKAELDQKIREDLHLGPTDPTAIASVIPFQNFFIETGVWRTVYTAPGGTHILFAVDYPPDMPRD